MSMDFDDAYFAGLIDGEGSFVCPLEDEGRSVSPRLQVGMTNKSIISLLRERYGGYINIEVSHPSSNWKDCYKWYVTGNELKETLIRITPFLKLKRRQAEILRTLVDLRRPVSRPRHIKTSDSEVEYRLGFINELRSLNKKGRA